MPKIVEVQWVLDTRTPVGVVWCAVSSVAQAKDDKVSIPMQRQLGLEWMEDQGITHVVILKIPGHSRSETLIEEALQEYREDGVTAYDDLKKLWLSGLLTKFWAFAHNRLGRANVQHSYVIENTIRFGAEIWLHHGGPINKGNRRGQIAMGGYEAASHNDLMVERWARAVPIRREKGLPMGKPYWTHRLIRGENGKALRQVVNEARLPFFFTIIQMVLDRVPWGAMAPRLAEMGYTTRTGKLYGMSDLQRAVYNPAFWGHTALGFSKASLKVQPGETGHWVYDETATVPPGITVWRNVIPPIVPDHLREQLIDELKRRGAVRGKNSPDKSPMFSRLIVCAVCGDYFNFNSVERGKYLYYICGRVQRMRTHKAAGRPTHNGCTNTGSLPVADVRAVVEQYLQMAVTEDIFERPAPDLPDTSALEKDIAALNARILRTIDESEEHPDLADLYRVRLDQLGAQRKTKQVELENVTRELAQYKTRHRQRKEVLAELRATDLAALWERPPAEINQFLLRVFGEARLYAKDRKIVGLTFI